MLLLLLQLHSCTPATVHGRRLLPSCRHKVCGEPLLGIPILCIYANSPAHADLLLLQPMRLFHPGEVGLCIRRLRQLSLVRGDAARVPILRKTGPGQVRGGWGHVCLVRRLVVAALRLFASSPSLEIAAEEGYVGGHALLEEQRAQLSGGTALQNTRPSAWWVPYVLAYGILRQAGSRAQQWQC